MASRRRCCCAGGTAICVYVNCSPSYPVIGALAQLYSGSTLVASCTTGSTGCCTFAQRGSYTVRVTISGSLVYSATRTLAGAEIDIILSASSAGVVCCGGYAIPQTMTLTDAVGSISFVYDPSYSYPLWTGGHSVTALSCSVTTPNNICIVAPASYGPVRVCYQMACQSGHSPVFTIQRSWSYVYQSGSLTVIYYQDSSGFSPGQFCITAPPAICGNPLTDTASCSTNPSSTSPFAISCSPVAATGNQTADPVGGSVAIS